jgi:uncharacterized membrane protein YecN with MAPEG domain
MHELEVTTFTAAVCGLIYMILSYRVSQSRMANKISMGDGGNADLIARMRTQANFGEYVPIILILMGLIESQIGYSVLLGIVSAVLILSRVAHAIGMMRPAPNPFRVGGTAGTWLSLLVLSIWGLIEAIRII